jgi:hypothetical protein
MTVAYAEEALKVVAPQPLAFVERLLQRFECHRLTVHLRQQCVSVVSCARKRVRSSAKHQRCHKDITCNMQRGS